MKISEGPGLQHRSQLRVNRHRVFRTDRIVVTESMIARRAPDRVLEIGAGDYSFEYLKRDCGGVWVKADFAVPCDVQCDINQADAVLPFSSGSFDLVVCTEVLEHLLWPQRLLAEAGRVLREGGALVASIPNVSSLTYRVAWIAGRIPSCAASGNLPRRLGSTAYEGEGAPPIGGHVIDLNLKRFRDLLAFCGFRVVETRGSGLIWHRQILPHWLVPVSLASNIVCLAEKPAEECGE